MNQKLQYFQWYCELNALPFDKSRTAIAELVSESKKSLTSYSRRSYCFEWFDQYCRDQIDLETFMTIGDGMNPQTISQHPLALKAVQIIQTQLKIRDDALQWSIVVVDQLASLGHDLQDLQEQLRKRWSELLIVTVWVLKDNEE